MTEDEAGQASDALSARLEVIEGVQLRQGDFWAIATFTDHLWQTWALLQMGMDAARDIRSGRAEYRLGPVSDIIRDSSEAETKERAIGMAALSFCAELEAFLTDWAPEPDRAAVKPTARQSGDEWFAAVERVFRVTIDPVQRRCLLRMIEARNEYGHQGVDKPRNTGVVYRYGDVTLTEVLAWLLATACLGGDVGINGFGGHTG